MSGNQYDYQGTQINIRLRTTQNGSYLKVTLMDLMFCTSRSTITIYVIKH